MWKVTMTNVWSHRFGSVSVVGFQKNSKLAQLTQTILKWKKMKTEQMNKLGLKSHPSENLSQPTRALSKIRRTKMAKKHFSDFSYVSLVDKYIELCLVSRALTIIDISNYWLIRIHQACKILIDVSFPYYKISLVTK